MALKWHGNKVQKSMRRNMQHRLDAAALIWVRHATRQLNMKTNRDGKTPSMPGEYPAMVTSHLRRNINWERIAGRLAVRVGTNVEYGKFLEVGTRKIAKRPWMTLTNRQTKTQIKNTIGRPMRSTK